MKEEIKKLIAESARKVADVEVGEISVEAPKIASHGDYSTNIALALAKKMNSNPVEIAQRIADGIQKPDFLEKVEAVAPGFINFYLSKDFFVENIKEVLSPRSGIPFAGKNKDFGKNQTLK